MKFYCDNCQTKYSIADHKVRGKVLKVRCKKCSHVITVREPKSPAPAQSASKGAGAAAQAPKRGGAAASSAPPPAPKWHYSINGQSFGPFDKDVLDEKLASGELGDAAYVWNESFSDWKRVTEVAAFADALEKAHSVRPSPKTHGVSQALEAIDSSRYDARHSGEETSTSQPARRSRSAEEAAEKEKEDEEAKSPLEQLRQKGSEETSNEARDSGEPEKAASPPFEGEDATEINTDLPDAVKQMRKRNRGPKDDEEEGGREDRLAKLRQRLQIGSPKDDKDSTGLDTGAVPPESEAEQENLEAPSAADVDAKPDDEEVKDPWEDSGAEEEKGDVSALADDEGDIPELDVAHADTLAADELDSDEVEPLPEAEEEPEPLAPAPGESVHDGLFGGADDDVDDKDMLPSPEATGPDPDDEEAAEDAVPFFPSAPTLEKEDDGETSMSRVDEITDSLLIQLDEIKGDGRKQAIVGGIGALVALVTVGTVGYFGFMAASASDEEGGGGSDDEPRIVEDGFGQAPERTGYTSEELAAISEEHVLEEQDLGSVEVDDEEGAAEAPSGGGGDGSAQESGSGYPTVDTSDIDVDMSDEVFDQARADGEARGDDTSGSALARQGDSAVGGSVDFDSLGEGGFGTGIGVDDDNSIEVHEIDEDLGIGQQELQQGLTTQDRFDAQGRITSRVVHCRQRHYNRGEGELPADNVQIQFYVLPDGEIAEFEITPASMGDTLFAQCLERDRRHWNYFPPFEGNPERIVLPMSLE